MHSAIKTAEKIHLILTLRYRMINISVRLHKPHCKTVNCKMKKIKLKMHGKPQTVFSAIFAVFYKTFANVWLTTIFQIPHHHQ